MSLRFLVISVGLLFSTFLTRGQKINLANFSLIQDNQEVLLSWIIDAGPTCNGVAILRSTDSLHYTEIGTIGGICGSTSSSIPYRFKDTSPILNKTNYYKLKLGFSQFSEVQSLYLEFIKPGKIIIKPNPSTENVALAFNNDKMEAFTISIISAAGLKVYELLNVRESSIVINTSSLQNGQYYIMLVDSGGRVIKEKFVISK